MAELLPRVLAHGGGGGGWDELLIFAVPALVFLAYLAARWRSGRKETERELGRRPGRSRNGPGSRTRSESARRARRG